MFEMAIYDMIPHTAHVLSERINQIWAFAFDRQMGVWSMLQQSLSESKPCIHEATAQRAYRQNAPNVANILFIISTLIRLLSTFHNFADNALIPCCPLLGFPWEEFCNSSYSSLGEVKILFAEGLQHQKTISQRIYYGNDVFAMFYISSCFEIAKDWVVWEIYDRPFLAIIMGSKTISYRTLPSYFSFHGHKRPCSLYDEWLGRMYHLLANLNNLG